LALNSFNENPKIAILGCTGSVGTQALDVADKFNLDVTCLSANNNYVKTEEYARRFKVNSVAMASEDAASELKVRLADTNIKIYSGDNGICEMVSEEKQDTVVNSIIGEAGLLPTLAVINTGTRLALANKESLVVAGEIVMNNAREKGVEILPVDSEHSAIFQCLKSGKDREVKKLLLTASGGPFFGKTIEELRDITVEQALAHPTWKMGAKITIDSATLMNKGFELIEAAHLFNVSPEQIEVVVHRESIIHSMVEYIDNSIIAQMSVPDMRLCIQYAVTYPHRIDATIKELDLFSISKLTFNKPDTNTFSLLECAKNCIKAGGAMPAVLNAANEVAVARFLEGKIGFYQITEAVEKTVNEMSYACGYHSLEDILAFDKEAREITNRNLNKTK
jgi:1-deoxy-D-xylulose-5-phosphate reductoisomerase